MLTYFYTTKHVLFSSYPLFEKSERHRITHKFRLNVLKYKTPITRHVKP